MSVSLLRASEVEEASLRLEPYIRTTPLQHVGGFFLKCEHEQRTGSFKIRGAVNKVFTLDRSSAARGATGKPLHMSALVWT